MCGCVYPSTIPLSCCGYVYPSTIPLSCCGCVYPSTIPLSCCGYVYPSTIPLSCCGCVYPSTIPLSCCGCVYPSTIPLSCCGCGERSEETRVLLYFYRDFMTSGVNRGHSTSPTWLLWLHLDCYLQRGDLSTDIIVSPTLDRHVRDNRLLCSDIKPR